MKGGDIMHSIPNLPPQVTERHMFATCKFQGDLQGSIEMRQRLGGGPLEMDFDVSGFPTGMVDHHHAFTAHWSGAPQNGCDLGRVFAPPHIIRGKGWGYPDDDDDLSAIPRANAEEVSRRRRNPAHDHSQPYHGGNKKEGDLGTVSCNAEGVLAGHDEYLKIGLLGLHSIAGRGLTIHATSAMDSEPLGCCTVAYAMGVYWGEESQWEEMAEEFGST